MFDNFWSMLSEHFFGDFARGFGTALAAAVLAIAQKDTLLRGLAYVIRDKHPKIRGEKWHTAFVQNGRAKVETVTIRSIPFTQRYFGVIEYHRSFDPLVSHYAFAGRFSGGLFTATYESEEVRANDCGAWTLKLDSDGTALVGAYVWLVQDGEIGHDFYQWTRDSLKALIRSSASAIDGVGVFPALSLPKGTLVGEFEGGVVSKPTRQSIKVDGLHINPSEGCVLKSLNHSCKPNAKFSGRLLFLTEPVSSDDEVTVDYRLTEQEFVASFACRCSTCIKTGSSVRIGRPAR
jgi:hypothetical protein